MAFLKTRIDKAGLALAQDKYKDEIDYIELEEDFYKYREAHLRPLSDTTIEIQRLLSGSGIEFYIAQRLKRKPQIVRKLKRLSVRLTQLQDIGGCRIIVPTNKDVDILYNFLNEKVKTEQNFEIIHKRQKDYREKGRDDTGYRALHLIIKRENLYLELQVRSRIQHYWAESIERTSVIYGHHLKENEGDSTVIQYFKQLSNIFYEIEMRREPSVEQKIQLDSLRKECEQIIQKADTHKIFDSFVNEGIIKTLVEKEKYNYSTLNNWILIFDWNEGTFVSWDIVEQDSTKAAAAYARYEKQYPAENGFEVVLIGSSDIASVRKTHSHYFGIESYNNILETLDDSIIGFAKTIDIDIGARKILAAMKRHKCWGTKTVSVDTLKNHFCKGLLEFEYSLKELIDKELIKPGKGRDYSLNMNKRKEIESYL